MKLLHTGDWHLGKLLHAVNLLDDQRHVLQQVVDAVEEERPDAVLVAGDVYDRAVPPAEAVELLDWVLTEIVDRLATPTVMIAGNHDSADRLQFGAALLRKNGMHVVGKLERGRDETLATGAVTVQTAEGPLHICPIPFTDPALARELLGDDSITTHDAAMRALAARQREAVPRGETAVLMAHVFAKGGLRSDSERTLCVGGAEEVGSDCFDGFAYVALGHLHRAQQVDSRVRYSGSPLKYSASEADHTKSLTIVEIGADGAPAIRERLLSPLHNLRRLKGTLADLEKGIGIEDNPSDYFVVELEDETMPVSAMARLRVMLPNTMDVTVPKAMALRNDRIGDIELEQLDDLALFDAFMEFAANRPMKETEREFVKTMLNAMNTGEGAAE